MHEVSTRVKLYRQIISRKDFTVPLDTVLNTLFNQNKVEFERFIVASRPPGVVVDDNNNTISLKEAIDTRRDDTVLISKECQKAIKYFQNKMSLNNNINLFFTFSIILVSAIAASSALQILTQVYGGILAGIVGVLTVVQTGLSKRGFLAKTSEYLEANTRFHKVHTLAAKYALKDFTFFEAPEEFITQYDSIVADYQSTQEKYSKYVVLKTPPFLEEEENNE